ncbi:hypothetical protein CAL7716_079780 [Calothrix sp. PCC 7716]|nr:hypothetical protein CAL7716_079780 [Calothrix sp. PCC 7716]
MQPILKRPFGLKFAKYQVLVLIGIAKIVILILLFKLNFTFHNPTPTWENALSNTPTSLLKKVLSVDAVRGIEQKSVKVMQISSNGASKLYLFDYHSPKLCGAKGCIYSMYTESGELILQVIANPYLPPLVNLFQVSETVNQKFPCLVITQSTANENMLSRTLYCYQGHEYARFNESLTAIDTNLKPEKGK